MTRREAKRIALLVVWHEVSASLDVSDEWQRHPETDAALTASQILKIKREGQAIADLLEREAERLRPPSSR